jgi:hypothetical protein
MQAACMAEDGCLGALMDACIDGWISHHGRTDGRTNQCLCQCEEAALRIVPRVGTKLLVVRLERLDHTAIICDMRAVCAFTCQFVAAYRKKKM